MRLRANGIQIHQTPNDAIKNYEGDAESLIMLVQEITAGMISLAMFHGGELTPQVASDIATIIFDKYWDFTPEDIGIFFRSARAGHIGSRRYSKHSKNINAGIICEWLETYSEEKNEVRLNKFKDLASASAELSLINAVIAGKEIGSIAEEVKKRTEEAYNNLVEQKRSRREELKAMYVPLTECKPWELEHLAVQGIRKDCAEMVETYWTKTPLKDQLAEWMPQMGKWLKDPGDLFYLILNNKDHLFVEVERLVKEMDPGKMKIILESAKKAWIDDLRKLGHVISTEQEKLKGTEIKKTLDSKLRIPNPMYYYRAELILWYNSNF